MSGERGAAVSVSTVIMGLILGCLALGACDYLTGNRLRLGSRFHDGLMAMGSLALSMAGIMALVPLLSRFVAPVVTPFFDWIGADPSLFAGMLLPIDMGGYTMALDLAHDSQIGLLSGCVLSTMMGCTVVFNIPVGLGIISHDDIKPFSMGMLCGFVTIPVGVLAAGLTMGIPLVTLMRNLAPIVVFSVLLMLGIAKVPRAMVRGFSIFGKLVSALSVVGLVLGAVTILLGIELVPAMGSLDEGLLTVGRIGVTLAGAFVLVELISRVAKKPLEALGHRLGIGASATLGILACLAHAIPMFQDLGTYSDRGKVVACAFSVSGSYMLASSLAFLAGVQPQMMVPMLVAKLVAGICALVLALFMTRRGVQGSARADITTPFEAVHEAVHEAR